MKLNCPNCQHEQDIEQFSFYLTCDICKAKYGYEQWVAATKKVKEEEEKIMPKPEEIKRKGLQIPAKLRFTQYGSVELRLFIPQNYLRVAMGLEKLPKELLKRAKPREK